MATTCHRLADFVFWNAPSKHGLVTCGQCFESQHERPPGLDATWQAVLPLVNLNIELIEGRGTWYEDVTTVTSCDALHCTSLQTARLGLQRQSWNGKSQQWNSPLAGENCQFHCSSYLCHIRLSQATTWNLGGLWFELSTQVFEKGVKHKSTHTAVDSEKGMIRLFHVEWDLQNQNVDKWTNTIIASYSPIQGYLVLNRKPKRSGLWNLATLQNLRLQFVSCLLCMWFPKSTIVTANSAQKRSAMKALPILAA